MRFLHDGSVWLEHLDAVIHAVRDAKQGIDGQIGTMHWTAELLSRRRIRIVVAEVDVIRLAAISTTVPLVIARVRIEHDDTMA
jgi:hypothetical protein